MTTLTARANTSAKVIIITETEIAAAPPVSMGYISQIKKSFDNGGKIQIFWKSKV